jgi:hypothetical protein
MFSNSGTSSDFGRENPDYAIGRVTGGDVKC